MQGDTYATQERQRSHWEAEVGMRLSPATRCGNSGTQPLWALLALLQGKGKKQMEQYVQVTWHRAGT